MKPRTKKKNYISRNARREGDHPFFFLKKKNENLISMILECVVIPLFLQTYGSSPIICILVIGDLCRSIKVINLLASKLKLHQC
jgi:hypothetical protein